MEKSMKDIQWCRLKELISDDYIPFFGGRPDRNHPITPQEVIDLKIDLWTTSSADRFLEKISRA